MHFFLCRCRVLVCPSVLLFTLRVGFFGSVCIRVLQSAAAALGRSAALCHTRGFPRGGLAKGMWQRLRPGEGLAAMGFSTGREGGKEPVRSSFGKGKPRLGAERGGAAPFCTAYSEPLRRFYCFLLKDRSS